MIKKNHKATFLFPLVIKIDINLMIINICSKRNSIKSDSS